MNSRSCSVIALPVVLALMLAGCSGPEESATEAPIPVKEASKPEAEKVLPKIPILPGFKYYVGGPALDSDAYGRFRLVKFQGEVEQPPSRGMVFGAKQEGDQLEYHVWPNGVLLGVSKGTMKNGLFWREYAEGYRLGKLVSREYSVADDEKEITTVTVEDIDPDNGEVIRKKQYVKSFRPPPPDKDMADDDDMDEDMDDDDAPAQTAPAAAPAEAPDQAAGKAAE